MLESLEHVSISEGHTRPLLMLQDRPEEQRTLFKEVLERHLTVRDTEALARRVAIERVRHKALVSPDLLSLEKQLSARLGARVRIEKKDTGGKLLIDFFSPEDLTALCMTLTSPVATAQEMPIVEPSVQPESIPQENPAEPMPHPEPDPTPAVPHEPAPAAQQKADDDLYSIRNFTL